VLSFFSASVCCCALLLDSPCWPVPVSQKGRAAAKKPKNRNAERTKQRNNEPNFQILNFQRELIRPGSRQHHTKFTVFAWNLKAVQGGAFSLAAQRNFKHKARSTYARREQK
jgi:hypothetical protein